MDKTKYLLLEESVQKHAWILEAEDSVVLQHQEKDVIVEMALLETQLESVLSQKNVAVKNQMAVAWFL